MGRDTPSIIYGGQEDYKRLYYSDPIAALKIPITISPGFGVLKMGTVISENDSSSGNGGKYIPYDPHATVTGAEDAPTRAYLVQDGAASTAAYVTIEDSYKFAVGDTVDAVDSDLSIVTCGAITAIDRTTYTHMANITVTNNVTTGITTAKFGYIYISGAETASGVLEKSVDTGTGSNAKGANATIIIKNAVLYTGMLENMDSNARTDLSATAISQFTYF